MNIRMLMLCAMLCAAAGVAHAGETQPLPVPLGDALPVEIVVTFNEVDAELDPRLVRSGVGGIIGGLMANHQRKAINELIAPTRELLHDYNFKERFEARTRAVLPSDGISPDPRIRLLGDEIASVFVNGRSVSYRPGQAFPYKGTIAVKDGTPVLAPHALVLAPRLAFDYWFQKLYVSVDVSIQDRTNVSDTKTRFNSRWSRHYVYAFPFTGRNEDQDVNGPIWPKFGKERLAALVDKGIDQVLAMIVYDFSAEGRKAWGPRQKESEITVKGVEFEGVPIRHSEDSAWLRVDRGPGFWNNAPPVDALEGYEPIDRPAPEKAD